MDIFLQSFKSETTLAFLASLIIFLLTLFLVIRRLIGFPMTLLLLLFAITLGLAISNQHILQCYVNDYQQDKLKGKNSESLFKKQVTQALQDVKIEVKLEKENFDHLMNQVEEMVDQLDKQKQKLQQFIEEAREQFAIDDKNKVQKSNEMAD